MDFSGIMQAIAPHRDVGGELQWGPAMCKRLDACERPFLSVLSDHSAIAFVAGRPGHFAKGVMP